MPAIRKILNLGKPDPDPAIEQAITAIIKASYDEPEIDLPASGEIGRLWQEALAGRGAGTETRVPVYSREQFIRADFYGAPDPTRLPKAMAAMAGRFRVVIVVRHQTKLLESLYLHKANSTSYLSADKWLATWRDRYAFGYRYGEIADAWAQVVGEQNVGVFMFEQLVSDHAAFARALCGFMGIDAEIGASLLAGRHENVRKTQRTQAYARLRAHVLPNVSLGRLLPDSIRRTWRDYLDRGHKARASLPDEWRARIEDHYRSDNQNLARRFGLPLQDFGYPL